MTPFDTVSSHTPTSHWPARACRRTIGPHARRRAAAPDVVLRLANALAAAGAHVAPGALGGEAAGWRHPLGRNLAPVALKLIGNQLCEAGERAQIGRAHV